jgi:hypothetical protein
MNLRKASEISSSYSEEYDAGCLGDVAPLIRIYTDPTFRRYFPLPSSNSEMLVSIYQNTGVTSQKTALFLRMASDFVLSYGQHSIISGLIHISNTLVLFICFLIIKCVHS